MEPFTFFPLLSLANIKAEKTLDGKLKIQIPQRSVWDVFILWNSLKIRGYFLMRIIFFLHFLI